jgi:hypothetical protein
MVCVNAPRDWVDNSIQLSSFRCDTCENWGGERGTIVCGEPTVVFELSAAECMRKTTTVGAPKAFGTAASFPNQIETQKHRNVCR